MTRDPPRYGELGAHEDPRWLGSIRWGQTLTGLAGLRHSDALLRRAWPTFLDVVQRQGDFGTVTLDPHAPEAWARYDEGQRALIGLLNEIATLALTS